MRIISSFRDYYDSALGYGSDPMLIYKRHTRQDPAGELPAKPMHLRPLAIRKQGPMVEYAIWYLAFCGSLYPLMLISLPESDMSVVWRCCWTLDDAKESLQGFEKELVSLEARGRGRFRLLGAQSMESLLEQVPESDGVHALHRRIGSPVALLRTTEDRLPWPATSTLIVDPVLKDIEFYRVLDPFSAFQRIGTYIGGVLGLPEVVHQPIPDDDLRDMKGFDDRSFKTDSPGKKTKRRTRDEE